MTRGGTVVSCAGVCTGDKTNGSSDACERGDELDTCDASDELEAARCGWMGRLGVGNGSRRE